MDRRKFIKVASALPLLPSIVTGSALAGVGHISQEIHPMHLDLASAKALCEDAIWRCRLGSSFDYFICLDLSRYETASAAALKYVADQPLWHVRLGLTHLSEEIAWIVGGMAALDIDFTSLESVSVGAASALCAQGKKHSFGFYGLRTLDIHAAEHIVSASQGECKCLEIHGRSGFELPPDLARALAESDNFLYLDLGDTLLQPESARQLTAHSGSSLLLASEHELSADAVSRLQANPLKRYAGPEHRVSPTYDVWVYWLLE